MATSNTQQYDEQLHALQESFPRAPEKKLIILLRRHDGNIDQVRTRLAHREAHCNKFDELETRFGTAVTALQEENPSFQGFKRARLLRIMNRFNGDIEQVQKFLLKVQERHIREGENSIGCRRQQREELKTKYATQLAEINKAGINAPTPCVLRQLEKNQGDANKVIEKMLHHKAKREKFGDSETKYAAQIAQLEADGVEIKNKRILAHLLEKNDGQVELVKQRINERKEKHQKRKEYQHKHRCKSPFKNGQEGGENFSAWKKRRELSADDFENLKRLRSAGIHGNPMKILKIFHDCNESIEMTMARTQEQREERVRNRDERVTKRNLLAGAESAYITLNNREDWPNDIEQVYLDGNNMMFVIDCLRRLCLKRAGQKTERAIGEIASAWNDKMQIPNIDLIYDSTRQLEQIGTVKVLSAQPQYKTTDDMLIEIVRRPENQGKNKRTIIVTSDRALAALLQREGCLLVKPYNWFAHCVMILTPDLINYEEVTGTMTTTSTPTTYKVRYNFDELVHRIANINL